MLYLDFNAILAASVRENRSLSWYENKFPCVFDPWIHNYWLWNLIPTFFSDEDFHVFETIVKNYVRSRAPFKIKSKLCETFRNEIFEKFHNWNFRPAQSENCNTEYSHCIISQMKHNSGIVVEENGKYFRVSWMKMAQLFEKILCQISIM